MTINPCVKCYCFHFTLLDEANVYCENGQALSLYGDFCHECHECPLATYSVYAMLSNCSKRSNNFCPMFDVTSKICMDRFNVNITDYCDYGEPWICPKANKGLNFEQCYDM